ncbi:thioesterase family protein [Streptomyces zingiberis]|uniref:Thioesterase family protein n=1 Tax=Streptomyces zingiberis TaxID=2053010 RepID=A0ABX1C538_9ACTN|nr:thioesterase family protein [Streptomyces zingiberis]NJQ03037.1 thioesterase family protein [Streptomyces zingiberis]
MAQGTIGNSEFDRDTAVTPLGPGLHEAELSPGWTILGAVNGGYLLALVGRALAGVLPHPDPVTVTAHYLTASRPGPARIRSEVVRAGRTLSTGQASLTQLDEDGREVERLRVLAGYGDLDALPDDVRTTAKPPPLPPYEECPGSRNAGGGGAGGGVAALLGSTEIAGRLDVRLDPATAGWALGTPSGNGEMRGWFALADGREADPLALLLAVDALPPTAFEIGLSGWVPTVELTAHVRCRPAPGPLRVAVTTRNLAGGLLEEDAEIWDSRDRLVAQSRQLARARLG